MGRDRTGSIVRRKNGKYYARITFTSKTGERIEKTRVGLDRKDAKRLVKDLLQELEEQGEKAIGADRIKVSEAIESYREKKAVEPTVRDGQIVGGLKSWQTVRIYLDVISSYFGEMMLKDLTPTDLEDFRQKRLSTPTQYKRERSIAAVQRELETLRAFLRWCVKKGWLKASPFDRCGETLIKKSAEGRRDRVLSPEEEDRLLAVCVEPRAHLRPIIIAGVDTGMRRGEIFKLRWSFVDLQEEVINLPAEITKTGKARTVPITSRLKAELKLLKENSNDGEGLVFGVCDIKGSFKTACRLAEIEDLHFHDLRHTATTRLISAGTNPALAMKITGHDQMGTFLRYLNPRAGVLREVGEALDKLNAGDSTIGEGDYVN